MLGTDGEFRPIKPVARSLVRPVPLDPRGVNGPTPGQARGPGWRQTTKGYYVPSAVSENLAEQRILEQSMRLPDGGAVTGWAGCRLAGAGHFDGLDTDGHARQPVPLLVPPDSKLRSLSGSTVRREPLPAREIRVVAGIPTSVPVRALFDEIRRVQDWREGVVALDMMAAAEQVSLREMTAYLAGRTRWRRASRVTWALGLASERSLLGRETRTRLVWVLDARLPPPLVNQPVFDLRGRLVCIADLFDPVAGVVGEYDGATHLRTKRRSRDLTREDNCRQLGLEYFKVTAADEPDAVVARMQSTRQRAPGLRGVRGTWTLEEPSWWDRVTAEDTLAHRDWLRSFHEPA